MMIRWFDVMPPPRVQYLDNSISDNSFYYSGLQSFDLVETADVIRLISSRWYYSHMCFCPNSQRYKRWPKSITTGCQTHLRLVLNNGPKSDQTYVDQLKAERCRHKPKSSLARVGSHLVLWCQNLCQRSAIFSLPWWGIMAVALIQLWVILSVPLNIWLSCSHRSSRQVQTRSATATLDSDSDKMLQITCGHSRKGKKRQPINVFIIEISQGCYKHTLSVRIWD